MKWLFKAFDLLRGPWLFQLVWRLVTRVSGLTEAEIDAASQVLGVDTVRYQAVRIAQGGLLPLLFKANKSRAFTTFHTINLPTQGRHSREHLDLLAHELVHVRQFEIVGSVYIGQALRAQRTDGYGYGGWGRLALDRADGKRFKDYNREQQGQIAQDYYVDVVATQAATDAPVRLAYDPFIEELKAGEL